MFKKVLILLLALAVPFLVMAQSSGKIIGIVTDKETFPIRAPTTMAL